MGRRTNWKHGRLGNLQGAASKVKATLLSAATTLKRLASPRKSPAKKRRIEHSENEVHGALHHPLAVADVLLDAYGKR